MTYSDTVEHAVLKVRDDRKLMINDYILPMTDGQDGEIMMTDGNGVVSWMMPPPEPPQTSYYPNVNICCQSWMTKNLDVRTYRNGDSIPHVTNDAEWDTLTTGAYCYFNNDSTNYAATYGKLYNWYAVNDPRGLAPDGWHIPSDFEWTTPVNCLGGANIAGGLLKETGTMHWWSPNTSATNVTNFTAVPGGLRLENGDFLNHFVHGLWWSSTEESTSDAWKRQAFYDQADLLRNSTHKRRGLSVRCIRD